MDGGKICSLKNCGKGRRLLEYEVYPTYIQTSRISAELEPRRRPELELGRSFYPCVESLWRAWTARRPAQRGRFRFKNSLVMEHCVHLQRVAQH